MHFKCYAVFFFFLCVLNLYFFRYIYYSFPMAWLQVSLLEYRKRLKEKPLSTSETKTSTSPAASAALTSSVPTPITHHKLSTTLSLYLRGSSPTSSFSSSPSKAAALPHSSNQGTKKGRMPTLATLPLFKSAEPKRGM